MRYAIAIAGFQPELIIKPFTRMLEPLDKMSLLITQNSKSLETAEKVRTYLAYANVNCDYVKIEDIFNFFEVMVTLETLFTFNGKPLWINVSAGPGIAISSLTFFAIKHDITVVFYNKENDKTSKVEISKSQDLFKKVEDKIELLRLIMNENLSLIDLSRRLKISKSTASRRVKLLKALYLVKTQTINKTLIISISETGLRLIEKYTKR
ncbi:MAG: hypothetical protein QXU18_03455 [Thermoplasmatales archaeon]